MYQTSANRVNFLEHSGVMDIQVIADDMDVMTSKSMIAEKGFGKNDGYIVEDSDRDKDH